MFIHIDEVSFNNSQLMHCRSCHFSWNPGKSFFHIHKAKIELLSFSCKILLLLFYNGISGSFPFLEFKLICLQMYTTILRLWILSGTTGVSLCQKKHIPTHTYRGHQSSLISFLHLLRFMSSSLFNLHAWQSVSTISVPSFLRSTSWPGTLHFILHTFQSLSSFCSTCPYHRNLLCCSTEIMLSNPSLSKLNLEGTLSCSLMPHIHLPAEVPPHFLSYGPGLSSTQHTTLHTTAVQSSSHYQWCILFGKQWYQLPEFIPSNSNSGLNSCISISIFTQHVIYCKTLNFGCP